MVKQARTCNSSKWSGGPSRRARRSGSRHWHPSNPRTRRDTTDRLRLAPAKSSPSPSWGGALSLPHLTSPTKSDPPTARGNGNPPTTETGRT